MKKLLEKYKEQLMTDKDLELIFRMVYYLYNDSKFWQKMGFEKTMEWVREVLENHTNRLIIPVGSTLGIFVDDDDFWKKRDAELKKEYEEVRKKNERYSNKNIWERT